MIRLVIWGAGGHAREIADIIDALNAVEERYQLLGFIDDDPAKHGLSMNGITVLGDDRWFETEDLSELRVVCGVGRPAARYKVVQRAKQRGLTFCSLVHPTASLTTWVEIGAGTVITSSCVLTNRIQLGDHVFIGPGVTISHDTSIDHFASLYPGVHVAGHVHLGAGCELGIGSSVIQSCTVGEWTIIGAGTTVVSDLPANCTAVGVPARVIKQRGAGWHHG